LKEKIVERVSSPLVLTAVDLKKMPRKTLEVVKVCFLKKSSAEPEFRKANNFVAPRCRLM
jgi:hypothetical protein